MSKGPYYRHRNRLKVESVYHPLVDIITYRDFFTFTVDEEKSMIPYSYVVLPQPEKKEENER